MSEQPAALFVVDACEDKNAIREANTLKIPVFAITDTNVDPTNIDYVIPANDDSIKATSLILDYVKDAIKTGAAAAPKVAPKAAAPIARAGTKGSAKPKYGIAKKVPPTIADTIPCFFILPPSYMHVLL